MFPAGKYIVFESVPDLSDNTKAVYDEMVKRGMNETYKLIWWVTDENQEVPKYKNTKYIHKNSFLGRLAFTWYTKRAKCLICCNRFLTSFAKNQTSFYLTHGTAVKSIHNYYNVPGSIDYILVASEASKEMMAYELNVDIEKVHALGFPRNDSMKNAARDLHECLEGDYKKVIVWYPTFRQHKNGSKTNVTNALPVLHDAEQAKKLNEIACGNEVLLVIKPHYAQDISYISNQNLSHIRFISDAFFTENQMSSYEFVGSADALITDYSSIYFDYLLRDKPVAVVWEDIEEYRQNPGFAIDVHQYMKCADKIYNPEDFKRFIEDVAQGNDVYKEARKEINAWANYRADAQNSARVVDFIIEKAGL